MYKAPEFTEDLTFLPVTTKQFEDLTNEILTELNKVTAPQAFEPDYMAQILMSAIHSLDHKNGKVLKTDLFENCLNRISCHLTYNVVQEIQARLKAKAAETQTTTTGDNVVPLAQEETIEEHA